MDEGCDGLRVWKKKKGKGELKGMRGVKVEKEEGTWKREKVKAWRKNRGGKREGG